MGHKIHVRSIIISKGSYHRLYRLIRRSRAVNPLVLLHGVRHCLPLPQRLSGIDQLVVVLIREIHKAASKDVSGTECKSARSAERLCERFDVLDQGK